MGGGSGGRVVSTGHGASKQRAREAPCTASTCAPLNQPIAEDHLETSYPVIQLASQPTSPRWSIPRHAVCIPPGRRRHHTMSLSHRNRTSEFAFITQEQRCIAAHTRRAPGKHDLRSIINRQTWPRRKCTSRQNATDRKEKKNPPRTEVGGWLQKAQKATATDRHNSSWARGSTQSTTVLRCGEPRQQ